MTDTSQVPSLVILGYHLDFFWGGVGGAIAVEVTAFAGHYDKGNFPAKYKKLGFYVVKLLLALIGGMLVDVYGVTTAPAAVQIGASASAVVLALARRETPPDISSGAAG